MARKRKTKRKSRGRKGAASQSPSSSSPTTPLMLDGKDASVEGGDGAMPCFWEVEAAAARVAALALEDPTNVGAQLASDDAYFCRMLDLIPAEFYFPKTDAEKEAEWAKGRGARFMVNKNKAVVGQSSNVSKRAKKRSKFENTETKTTSDLVGKPKLAEAQGDADKDGADAAEQQDESPSLAFGETQAPAKNLTELRERLALKLKKMKAQRAASATKTPRHDNRPRPSQAEGKAHSKQSPSQPLEMYEKLTASMGDSKSSPAENIKENISFGTLEVDGKDVMDNDDESEVPKKKEKGGKILRVEKLLQRVRADKDKIRTLKEEGNVTAAEKLAADKKWDVMERRAAGEKVIDEPKVIKKKLRQLEKKRKQSAKMWSDRKAATKAAKKDRIAKREANIESKRQQRVNKKLKRKGIKIPNDKQPAKKSRKQRAGFEGRRSSNVN